METISKIQKRGEADMDHIKNICKIGQRSSCCRYLVAGSMGFECAKESSLKTTIDFRVDQMISKGDNCAGYTARLKTN